LIRYFETIYKKFLFMKFMVTRVQTKQVVRVEKDKMGALRYIVLDKGMREKQVYTARNMGMMEDIPVVSVDAIFWNENKES
jgi:hypothetical protein